MYFYDVSSTSWTQTKLDFDDIEDLSTYNSSGAPWIILQDGNGMEMCINRYDSYPNHWQIKFSRSAGFTDTASTTTPTATDEFVLFKGSLTTQYDSYGAVVVDDSDPYNFYMAAWKYGDFIVNGFLMRAYFDTSKDSTFPDNNVYVVGNYNTDIFNNYAYMAVYNMSSSYYSYSKNVAMVNSSDYNVVSQTCFGWYRNYAYRTVFPLGISDDHSSNVNVIRVPVPYIRPNSYSTPNGFSGITSFIEWNGHAPTLNGQTINNKNYIVFGQITLPWDPTVTPRY